MNQIVLIGRLTRDPELRYTSNGTAVAKFTLAVDRRQIKDREKEVDFIDIVVLQKQAENCANYLAKGRQVGIVGRLQIRSYEDKNGNKRKIAEVVAEQVQFLGSKNDNSRNQPQGDPVSSFGAEEVPYNESEVPF